jgi:hypothetical protein
MTSRTKPAKKRRQKAEVGQALTESLSEAVAWARGEIALPVRESVATRQATAPSKVTVGELAADLIGSVEGPGDLTTNPKHMAGYGESSRGRKGGA